MNKMTKGAIAAAAGVVLLMGGAGTLAYWNSSAADNSGTTITAGSLSLASNADGVWKNNGTTITPSTFKVVPGDVLTYTESFKITATGNNLNFTVAATPGAFGTTTAGTPSGYLAAQLAQNASFAVTGTAVTNVSGNKYKVASGTGLTQGVITVTMTVTFNNGPAVSGATVDNTAQLGSVTLNSGAVTLTQVA